VSLEAKRAVLGYCINKKLDSVDLGSASNFFITLPSQLNNFHLRSLKQQIFVLNSFASH
jgi:hypothetical protein